MLSSLTYSDPKFSAISKKALSAPVSIPFTLTEVTVGISLANGISLDFSGCSSTRS